MNKHGTMNCLHQFFAIFGFIADIFTFYLFFKPWISCTQAGSIMQSDCLIALPIKMDFESYAFLVGSAMLISLTVTGIFWWSVIDRRSIGCGLFVGGWTALQLVTSVAFATLFWIYFQALLPFNGIIGWFIVVVTTLVTTGVLSYFIYHSISRPKI